MQPTNKLILSSFRYISEQYHNDYTECHNINSIAFVFTIRLHFNDKQFSDEQLYQFYKRYNDFVTRKPDTDICDGDMNISFDFNKETYNTILPSEALVFDIGDETVCLTPDISKIEIDQCNPSLCACIITLDFGNFVKKLEDIDA